MTLNPDQKAAVNSQAAFRVVIAGPGSGKTRTMVEAITEASGRVAIMTFTNGGADELRERLALPFASLGLQPWQQAIFDGRKIVHLGTLHAYCFKLIQRYGGWIGYIPGKVTILPDDERVPRLLQCRDKLGQQRLSEKVILARQDTGDHRTDQAVALVWHEYEFLLKRSNMVDFDLILEVASALLTVPMVRKEIQLDHLFVDEYQDSAKIDQVIYDLIPAKRKMIVGDPDQSIFGFRGANMAGLIKKVAGGGAEVFRLELNYRSDMDICTAANALIAHNKERVEKEIIPVSTELGAVGLQSFEDVGQELAWLASTIRDRAPDYSVAVLSRTHYVVEQVRDHLRAMGVPVQRRTFPVPRGDWERAKLLIGLAIAPSDILVERYLRLELGAKEVERLKAESAANGSQFVEAARLKITSFHNQVDVMPYLMMNGITEATAREIRVKAEALPSGSDLTDLLHELHSREESKETVEEGVYCGTVHSAKGREWDVVFLPAFEQGIFPHTRLADAEETERTVATAFPSNLEEERRLAFVAVTRARHELYISHVEFRRNKWGPIGGAPSQFLKEMWV